MATKREVSKANAEGAASASQRVFERHDLEIEVELLGYQRDGRENGIGAKPDPDRKFRTSGVTLDLSLGGTLARVVEELSEGSHCLVRFLGTGTHIRPELRWGLVLRSQPLENGEYEIAVNFDNPLEKLDADALVAG